VRGYAAATMMLGAGMHLILAILHFGTSPAVALLLGAMSAWCLHCAFHLWQSGSMRAWTLAAAGGFGMIVLHVGLMVVPHTAGPHHAVDLGGLMSMAMATGIVAEVVVIAGATVSLFGVQRLAKDSQGVRRRRRSLSAIDRR
jgi:hypothetical protein